MNNYTKMIGTMLILVYSLAVVFFILDRIFVNIIYFQGMLYTQIVGVPAFLFLNVTVILACIIMGSIVAYRQNEQLMLIKNEIEQIEDGVQINTTIDQNMEVIDVLHAINEVSVSMANIKRQNQLVTNDVHKINEETVKQIVEE